jgi:hypothetical protein
MVSAVDTSSLILTASDSHIVIGQNTSLTLTNVNSSAAVTSIFFTTTGATGGLNLKFTPSTISTLDANSAQTITVAPINFNSLSFGNHDITVNAVGNISGGQTVQASVPLTVDKGLCEVGPRGTNLTLSRVKIRSSGDKDEEWKLLDTVEVEVKVEDRGEDVNDVFVDLVLYDGSGNDVTGSLDFLNADEDQIELGDFGHNDDDTATFEFQVPADFDTGSYKLAVKAYSDGNEGQDCIDSSGNLNGRIFQSISIKQENDDDKLVTIDNVNLPSETTCSESATGSFEVFNVGDKDQDQVRITMFNKELGLNQEFEIRNNLDRGDSEVIDFTLDLPNNMQNKKYPIMFRAEYSYRNGNYQDRSDDLTRGSLNIIGCASSGSGSNTGSGNLNDVDISPTLKSSAQAGSKLVVDAIITNTGSQPVTLALDASGYQSWAKLDSVSSRTLSLDSGDSQTVTFAFTVDDTAAGAQSFTLQARGNGDSISQPVEVNLESKSSGFNFSGNASLLWIIGIINVVLIVLIIIVAVRLSRR